MDKAIIRRITTQDGSDTIYAPDYDQCMHSTAGAWEESLHMHVYPSRALERASSSVHVIDMGFGMGYNILALLYEAQCRGMSSYFVIHSFEKLRAHSDMIQDIRFQDNRDSLYTYIQQAFFTGFCEGPFFAIRLYWGDARDTLQLLDDDCVDAVFQDPFSPGRNPELWSFDFFLLLKQKMKKDALLTTYSSAAQVRRAMADAGFSVAPGPAVGDKKEGTLASPADLPGALDADCMAALCRNPKSVPYRDNGLCAARDEMLEQRIRTMREIRLKADRPARQE